jgi:hypothetical protein
MRSLTAGTVSVVALLAGWSAAGLLGGHCFVTWKKWSLGPMK